MWLRIKARITHCLALLKRIAPCYEFCCVDGTYNLNPNSVNLRTISLIENLYKLFMLA